MNYIIGKINKDTNDFSLIFGGSSNNIEFDTDIYRTKEGAEKAIKEKEKDLSKKANDIFNSYSETKKETIRESLKKPNAVFSMERWIIIPIEGVFEVSSKIESN